MDRSFIHQIRTQMNRKERDFNTFSILMNLKSSFRQDWLGRLPIEVQMLINTKVKDEFYATMTELQEIIIDLNENQAAGLEMV